MFRKRKNLHVIRYLRWAAAAAAIILALTAGWWLMQKEQPAQQFVENKNIEPGSNGAILTLADGRTLVLDSIA